MSDVDCHTDTKDGLPCTDYFHIAYAPPLGAVDVPFWGYDLRPIFYL